jgi:endonuclease-3
MDRLYPDGLTALEHRDAFGLLVAVILSAQTTDAAVNQVTPELFRRWPDIASMAEADERELAEVIRRIGLFRVKAKHCVQAAQIIMSEHAGQVPNTMAGLQGLPGVGRKTANIVLNFAFGCVEGIAVDTHVFRIAHRLRFSPVASDSPKKVEQDLMQLYPYQLWGRINHRWVQFGRDYCQARQPRCADCPIAGFCPTAPRPKAI